MVAQPTEDAAMSMETYLALEETSQVKHEYRQGYLHTMSGGTLDHDRIANEIRTMLNSHLGDRTCEVFGPDVRVRVASSFYFYPDVLVICDTAIGGRAIEVTTPRLIVEVISDSTVADDREEKFAAYQTLASLEEYLLVDSRQRAVERYHRTSPDLWSYQRYGPEATISLESIGLTCPIAAFYRRTQL